MKKLIIAVILLVVLGGITFAFWRNRGDEAISVTVQPALRGDITSVVTATGKTYPEMEVKISSEVAGEIIDLPVVDGQSVQRGDLLVRVNPDTLEAQAKQQEAALRASRANAAEAQAQLAQAELDLQRVENLFSRGYATQEQVDAMRTAYEVRSAAAHATEARIEQQEMALKEAVDLLAKATIYSPINGTVTVLSSELGDRVVGTGQFEGTEIMRVANLDNMEVRVEVSETDIVSVKVGDSATVELDAIPNEMFEGVVTEIANSAADQTASQQSSQDQLTTFLVKVRLLAPSAAIRPGMTATADIQTQSVTDVVKVPLQSVTVRPRDEVRNQLGEQAPAPSARRPEGGNGNRAPTARPGRDTMQRVVFVVRAGQAYLVPVETGIADNRFIEIKSGLEGGESVVTGSYRVLSRELAHEMEVQVEDSALGGFPGARPGPAR